jgi:hypothetical protein
VLQVADAPLAAFAECETSPPDVPATHNDAVAPAHANAFVPPLASVSETQVVPPSTETLVVSPLLEKQTTPGLDSAVSCAQLTVTIGSDVVETFHVGVAAPGFVLVEIRLALPTFPAAMQKAVVGHERLVIELRPVDDELAPGQDEGTPGVVELSTVPVCSAAKHSVADGHANPANGAAPQPTSPPPFGLLASLEAQSSEPLPATHTVVDAPAAHAGATASNGVDGANR